tara:strand:+ start:1095 stop:1217 length:123 start_codon:yes stop_codon:yes gene_type:complete
MAISNGFEEEECFLVGLKIVSSMKDPVILDSSGELALTLL